MFAKTCLLLLVLYPVSYGMCQSREAAKDAETKPDAAIPGLTDEQSRFFRYFDANQDGQISREEYRNVIVRFFERMDRRHHGYVDDAEMRKAFPAVRQGQPIDPHLRMSLTEFEDFMLARFDKADVEHNGVLPPAEFKVLQNTPE
jgi:Ca2+-binding EF-hand superfamily protein